MSSVSSNETVFSFSLQMRYKAAMRGETKLGIALDT